MRRHKACGYIRLLQVAQASGLCAQARRLGHFSSERGTRNEE